MSSITQKQIDKQNVKKTQVSWRSKLAQTHARSQPEGKERAKPGSTEKGEYYHVEIRPREEFTRFHTYVNEKTGIQRVAGRHKTGTWDDQEWLISKEDAHIENERLIPDSAEAQDFFKALGSKPVHVMADRFKVNPEHNLPESTKRNLTKKGERRRNISHSQAAQKKS